jgi:hypothetical protein
VLNNTEVCFALLQYYCRILLSLVFKFKNTHMKKLYFLVLSFFAGLTLTNAQILTQSNHAPTSGDMYDMLQLDSTSITPGPSGSSVTWNFTAPTRTNIILASTTCTTGSSISSGSLYPVGSVAKTTGTATTNFYTSTGTQLNFWGGNIKIATISANYYFNTPAIHASYPMSYNTTTTSVFTGSAVSTLGSGGITGGTSTVIVDGLGTLNLPSRSVANVLRVKTTTSFNFAVSIVTGNVVQESYDYYTNLTNFPSTKVSPLYSIVTSTIASSIAATQTSTLVFINKDYQYVGLSENSNEVAELNLFPNPATNNFNLVFVNENAQQVTVEITNALGQLVRKENLANTKGLVNQSVNIAGIEAGVYFVKVNVGAKSSVKKLTIQ